MARSSWPAGSPPIVELPLLLDADGLNAHAGALESLFARDAPTVLTPHAGELARLLGSDSSAVGAHRLHSVREAARKAGAVVVLKGDDTLVARPDGVCAVNRGGAPALATAGTGDVLSGVIGSYLAKGMDPFAAACAGVIVHAQAGRIAARADRRRGRDRPGCDRGAPGRAPGPSGRLTDMAVRALARVNLAAIERNVRRLRGALTPGTEMCAVIKADAYGHGAVAVARAAQAAGAGWLAVASAQEAAELREAGLTGAVLVMGALSSEELPVALAAGADVVAWTEEFVADLRRAAAGSPVGVHVKLDTGMGRFGTRDLQEALRVAEGVAGSSGVLNLRGAMTHLATADCDPQFTAAQLEAFAPFVAAVRERWPEVLVHAANSAAVLTLPESHFDLVRCGLAVYGCDPMGGRPEDRELDPALELISYVAAIKPARPGDTLGYGRTFTAPRDTLIATVPIGYADGIARALGNRGSVLIGGRAHPVVGTISMDNLTVDLGPDAQARVGDRVTIIGADGPARQTAEDLARQMRTISWEVLCGISERVPRLYHRDGVPE